MTDIETADAIHNLLWLHGRHEHLFDKCFKSQSARCSLQRHGGFYAVRCERPTMMVFWPRLRGTLPTVRSPLGAYTYRGVRLVWLPLIRRCGCDDFHPIQFFLHTQRPMGTVAL